MKVFILNVSQANLFPTTIKPINLTSIPHVEMLKQVILEREAVAIGFHIPGESHIQPVAGFGYPYIAQIRPDGSALVYIQGEGKVNLEGAPPLPTAHVTYVDARLIEENDELKDSSRTSYEALEKYFYLWIEKYVVDPGQKDFFLKSLKNPKQVIAACSSYLVRDFELQYELMEMFDINEQVEYLHRLLLSNQLIS